MPFVNELDFKNADGHACIVVARLRLGKPSVEVRLGSKAVIDLGQTGDIDRAAFSADANDRSRAIADVQVFIAERAGMTHCRPWKGQLW